MYTHSLIQIKRYETSQTFRERLDECCEVVDELLSSSYSSDDDESKMKISLKEIIFQKNNNVDMNNEPHILQPALFCVEYAFAKMLTEELGIEPSVLCGHSIGEYVAATLSGVFNWKDALRMIVMRGRVTKRLSREGAMLSVRTTPSSKSSKELFTSLSICVAARNAPGYFVLSGAFCVCVCVYLLSNSLTHSITHQTT